MLKSKQIAIVSKGNVMKYKLGLGLCAIALCACDALAPVSPLELKENVALKGQVLDVNGQPWKGSVTLVPRGDTVSQQTSETGEYQFDLLGFEVQTENRKAVPIELKATHASGATLVQKPTILKAETTLPTMRFWDGLEAPEKGSQIDKGPVSLSWNSSEGAEGYEVYVSSKTGITLTETVQGTTWTLPDKLIENQSTYTWYITALHAGYRAESSAGTFSTGNGFQLTLPISDIQVNNETKPKLFDGNLSNSENFIESASQSESDPVEIVIDLGGPQDIETLVYYGGGFSGTAQIYVSNNRQSWGERVTSEGLDSPATVFTLKQSQKRYIKMEIRAEGFININEIKVLKASS